MVIVMVIHMMLGMSPRYPLISSDKSCATSKRRYEIFIHHKFLVKREANTIYLHNTFYVGFAIDPWNCNAVVLYSCACWSQLFASGSNMFCYVRPSHKHHTGMNCIEWRCGMTIAVRDRRRHGRQQGRARGGECPLLEFENDDLICSSSVKYPTFFFARTSDGRNNPTQISQKCQKFTKLLVFLPLARKKSTIYFFWLA